MIRNSRPNACLKPGSILFEIKEFFAGYFFWGGGGFSKFSLSRDIVLSLSNNTYLLTYFMSPS
jgi:hypothetical protein